MRLTFFDVFRQIKASHANRMCTHEVDLVSAAINLQSSRSCTDLATVMHQGKGGQPYRLMQQTAALHVDGIHAATKRN
jgi:hypothetical protein